MKDQIRIRNTGLSQKKIQIDDIYPSFHIFFSKSEILQYSDFIVHAEDFLWELS